MGVYQKLGIRKQAIKFIDFITWGRQYGFGTGSSIYRSLSKSKDGFFKIKTNFFKNIIWLRDNFSDKAIFNQVFYQRQYYIERLSTIDAKYIIDAGANVGFASIYFSQLFPSASILALEPQLDNYNLLKKNTIGYTNVKCINAALWNADENIDIQNPESLAASYMVEARPDATIKATTLTSLLSENEWSHIDILKMDIEGAEKEVFSGDTKWLDIVKVLIIELHDNYKPDCTKTFFKALEPYSYEAIFHHENIFIFFK